MTQLALTLLDTQICRWCNKALPLTAYNWANKEQGRRHDRCRSCFSAYNRTRYLAKQEEVKAKVRQRRQEFPEKVRAEDRAKYQRHKVKRLAQQREYQRKRRQQHPEHNKAYSSLQRAVKSGKIERPDHCTICSKPCKPEGHHEDYSLPLNVVWVCAACHRNIHHGHIKLNETPP